MTERRTATVDQLDKIKEQLNELAVKVHELAIDVSNHGDTNEKEFLEVRQKINEVKEKVVEIETELPKRISDVETLVREQSRMGPKVDEMYDIVTMFKGFAKVMGWIFDNIGKVVLIVSVVATVIGVGSLGVNYVQSKFKITPIEHIAVDTTTIPADKVKKHFEEDK